MTYQFDPAPDGLRYEPIKLSFTSFSLWYLRDQAPEPWIDLRSALEIAGAPWKGKWSRYCQTKQGAWQLESCTDRKMRETMLAPANRFSEILGELEQQLERNGQIASADQLAILRSQWRYRLEQTISGLPAPKVSTTKKTTNRTSTTKSRITPYTVNQIYLLIKKGHTQVEIGKALRLSSGTVSLIISGKYSSFDLAAKEAWQGTFGNENSAKAV